jgi:small-conductance mechanosensitive channel
MVAAPPAAMGENTTDPLSNSLSLLQGELERLREDHAQRVHFFKEFAEMQYLTMTQFVLETDKIGMALYSQSNKQTLQLAFVCNKAVTQCELFDGLQQPLNDMLRDLRQEINRYDKLISTLQSLPPVMEQPVPSSSSIEETKPAPSFVADSSQLESSDSVSILSDSISQSLIAAQSQTPTDSTIEDEDPSETYHQQYKLSASQIADRNNCVKVARNLRESYMEIYAQIDSNRAAYIAYTPKLNELRTYAEERYNDIQNNIFHNSQPNYFKRLSRAGFFLRLCYQELKDKYFSGASLSSGHNGIVVLAFVGIILLWIGLSVLLSNVVVRHMIPSRFITPSFIKKKKYYVMAASMLFFSLLMVLMKPFYNDDFITTATALLIQFSLLMMVIMLSLIFRYNDMNIRSGLDLYLPVMVTGFIIITFRITFMSDTVLAMFSPPFLLVFTIWQMRQSLSAANNVPMYDNVYGWMSLGVLVVTSLASWFGYTMLSIYIVSWWLMQLTCLHAITSLRDAMRIYEDKWLRLKFFELMPNNAEVRNASIQSYYKRKGDFLRLTWFADLINMVVLPVMAILSLPLCLLWASQIFNLVDTCTEVILNNFIDVDGLGQLSIFKILTGTTLFFIFRFANYVLNSLNKNIVNSNLKEGGQGNVPLMGTLIGVLTWGVYGLTLLVLLNVSRSGLSIVAAGLATGIGFAMRDMLNNFFYGLSLMMGRLKVGEMIECDNIRGQVDSINYQSTQIRTIDGNVLSILNSTLFQQSFKNLTRDNVYELVKLPIGVAYGTDVERVRKLLTERVATLIDTETSSDYDIDPSRGISVTLVNFGDSSVDLTVNFWVRVSRKPIVCAMANEIVYNTLCQNNIEIPFPQTDVHIKNN